MGAKLRINSTWYEPALLWTVVAARKGEKKSAAGSVFLDGIERLEKRLQEQVEDRNDGKTEPAPRLYVNIFSFERLHQLMLKNSSQMLSFFDESII
jgi:hypothetical protein